jgi:hypothetical protein
VPGILIYGDLRVIQTDGGGATFTRHDKSIDLTDEELRWLLVGAIPAVLAGRHPDRPPAGA